MPKRRSKRRCRLAAAATLGRFVCADPTCNADFTNFRLDKAAFSAMWRRLAVVTGVAIGRSSPDVSPHLPLQHRRHQTVRGLKAMPQQANNTGLGVSLGFADNSSATRNFPSPWQGAPSVNFVGGGTSYDAGAIRLDNLNNTAVTIDSVSVDMDDRGQSTVYGRM